MLGALSEMFYLLGNQDLKKEKLFHLVWQTYYYRSFSLFLSRPCPTLSLCESSTLRLFSARYAVQWSACCEVGHLLSLRVCVCVICRRYRAQSVSEWCLSYSSDTGLHFTKCEAKYSNFQSKFSWTALGTVKLKPNLSSHSGELIRRHERRPRCSRRCDIQYIIPHRVYNKVYISDCCSPLLSYILRGTHPPFLLSLLILLRLKSTKLMI